MPENNISNTNHLKKDVSLLLSISDELKRNQSTRLNTMMYRFLTAYNAENNKIYSENIKRIFKVVF